MQDHHWPTDFGQEFHDLQELCLNFDSQTGQLKGSWGNLGLWQTQDGTPLEHYVDAATELADRLAQATHLQPHHRLLDVGFGCADQIIHWQTKYGVRHIWGINYSHVQTQYAQNKLSAFNCDAQLQKGDATNAAAWQRLPVAFDRIIALDCIYHFAKKDQFFQLCGQYLNSQSSGSTQNVGELVMTDLILTKPIRNPVHLLMLKLICHVSHIPYSNLKLLADYESDLTQFGLHIIHYQDLTDAVMAPFSQWVFRYKQQMQRLKSHPEYGKRIQQMSWLKYMGTALFLRWAARYKILSYALIVMQKKDY